MAVVVAVAVAGGPECCGGGGGGGGGEGGGAGGAGGAAGGVVAAAVACTISFSFLIFRSLLSSSYCQLKTIQDYHLTYVNAQTGQRMLHYPPCRNSSIVQPNVRELQ